MNGQTTPPQTQTAVVVAPKREIRVVEDNSPLSFIMDTAKFEHCYRIAEAMSRASLIPRHLKGSTPQETAANCFLVVNQALRWHMDPFAVAPETYEVGGKLGYQGKLVAAVINTRAGLRDKLSYEFSGERGTDGFSVTVSGRFEGEDSPKTVTVSVGQARTSNQMWTKDPEQKLVYTGSIRWARRHAPEIIMGVTTDDDLDMMREEAKLIAMKPAKAPVFDGPQPALNAPPVELEKPKRPRKTLVEEPLDPPKPVEQAPPVEAQQTVPVAIPPAEVPQPTQPAPVQTTTAPAEEKPEDKLVKLCAASGFTVEQFIVYLKAKPAPWMKENQTKLTEMSSAKLTALVGMWANSKAELISRIKKANGL